MNRTDSRRLGLAWGASVALAALAGALTVWLLAPEAPGGVWAAVVGVGAATAAVLAVSLAFLTLRRPAASANTASAPPGQGRGTATAAALRPAPAPADTRPGVWSDALAPVTSAAPAATPAKQATATTATTAAVGNAVVRATLDGDGTPDILASGAEPGDAASPASPKRSDAAATPPGVACGGRSDAGRTDAAADTLQDALRQALDAGEMRLVYQPIFDFEARHVRAVEALLRWPRASKSLLPTQDIVATADRGGFGADLGRFVLAAASQQMVRWQHVLGATAPARVCINLSRRQCLADALLDDFERALDAHGLRAEHFQFELAERDVVADAGVEVRLHELRALGASVALDHFGTANSSLTALQRLPVDTVKFDRDLVQRAETDSAVRLVLESTLGLAAELGLEIVVEGVETTQQLALLRSLGCRLAQGHALCPPMDPFALTRRLRGGHWLTEAARAAPAPNASGG